MNFAGPIFQASNALTEGVGVMLGLFLTSRMPARTIILDLFPKHQNFVCFQLQLAASLKFMITYKSNQNVMYFQVLSMNVVTSTCRVNWPISEKAQGSKIVRIMTQTRLRITTVYFCHHKIHIFVFLLAQDWSRLRYKDKGFDPCPFCPRPMTINFNSDRLLSLYRPNWPRGRTVIFPSTSKLSRRQVRMRRRTFAVAIGVGGRP